MRLLVLIVSLIACTTSGCSIYNCANEIAYTRHGAVDYEIAVTRNNKLKMAAYRAYSSGSSFNVCRTGPGIDGGVTTRRLKITNGVAVLQVDFVRDPGAGAWFQTYDVIRIELCATREGVPVVIEPEAALPQEELFLRLITVRHGELIF